MKKLLDLTLMVLECYLVFGTMIAYSNESIGGARLAIQLGIGAILLCINLKSLDK